MQLLHSKYKVTCIYIIYIYIIYYILYIYIYIYIYMYMYILRVYINIFEFPGNCVWFLKLFTASNKLVFFSIIAESAGISKCL